MRVYTVVEMTAIVFPVLLSVYSKELKMMVNHKQFFQHVAEQFKFGT